jgi:hypothetical protein
MKPKLMHWCVLAFVNHDPLMGLCVDPLVHVTDARLPEPIKAAKFAVHDAAKDEYSFITVSHRQVLEVYDKMAEPPTVPQRLAQKRRRK